MFLSGQRAPALIGQSLATAIRLEIPQLVGIILNWAMRRTDTHLIDSLMFARNKVFDIFFYRVVKFEGIYNFFPAFEQYLITAVPYDQQARLAALFQQFRWQDIRPIGTIRDQQQFVMELRKDIKVQTEKFNEGIYKNATFSVLSVDKQFVFQDEQMGEQIAGYQNKVQGIFTDFLDLVKDKQLKKEILIANESDRYNSYQKKEAFKIEQYLIQLADLGIALFNDDFLYQSMQIFSLIRELRAEYRLRLDEVKRFQDKGELFNTQKIEDYANTRTGCLLVKQILSLFTFWRPQRLLTQLQVEENRRVRKMLLKVLECYGKEIYGLLINELQARPHSVPWYYTRNIAYLLGRVTCDDENVKNQAVELLCNYWHPNTQRGLVNQIVQSLGFIATDHACDRLIERLKLIEPSIDKDRQTQETFHKVIGALYAIESDRSLETAIEYAQKYEVLGQHLDKFNKLYLSDRIQQFLCGKIRKELSRLKFSFALLGDKETALELLRMVSHMGNETVHNLCRDILKTASRKHALAQEAERILQQTTPFPLYSKDHMVQKLALLKNLPECVCHIAESHLTGRLVVRTNEGVEAEIEFDRGEAIRAAVNAYYLEKENAFYWAFLLDASDIESIYFHISSSRPRPEMEITRPTEALICDGLVQRGQVLQITGNFLSPDSRFRQRQVNSFFTNFGHLDAPEKYSLVWNALAQDSDIPSLIQATRLSKHDVYKILFYFLKQNMIVVDGEAEQQQAVNIEDGIVMLDTNLKRIERRPVMFNYYKTSAEICADLIRTTDDDVIRFAFGVLRNYYLEHFQHHKVFTAVNIEICMQVLGLAAAYGKTHGEAERQELVNYISFTFEITDLSAPPEAAPEPPPQESTVLEKLENIDLANDPFDKVASGIDDTMVDEMFDSLDAVLGSSSTGESATGEMGEPQEGMGLTEAEEAMLRDLFDNIALAYVKPLKDFIRELYRNWEAGRPTSLEWIEVIEPVFMLLSGSSAKMGYQSIAEVIVELHNVVLAQKTVAEREGRDAFNEYASQIIIAYYQKLCELQPKTFALVVSEDDLNDKKEVLIVKFILKQVPELTDKLLNKILFAGLNSFDKFMQTRPDEVAALTGMAKPLAEEICLKFYHYRNIYYQHGDPEYQQKFLAMFELNLRLLKEMHNEVEIIALEEQLGKEDAKGRKEILKIERQRTLWSLFILLCIKEEYDLVEMIQQSVFDVRIQLLEEYLVRLASMIQQGALQPQATSSLAEPSDQLA